MTRTTKKRANSSPTVFPDATFSRSLRPTSSPAAAAFTASRSRNPREKGHVRCDSVRLLLGQARQRREGESPGALCGREWRKRDPDPGIVRDSLLLPGPGS